MISTCQSTTHVDKLLRKILTFDSTEFWWMPKLIALLTYWKIRRLMRSSVGSASIRVPRSSAVTGMASTPVPPPTHRARVPRCRAHARHALCASVVTPRSAASAVDRERVPRETTR